MDKAILDISESSWISAHAGTGKTKVIIDRILALMLSGVLPQKILAVTFTNAAAAEMKDRVAAEIERLHDYNDQELLEFLNAFFGNDLTKELTQYRQNINHLYETYHELRVQTIHSFCQNILQLFPLEAGLKQGFEIVDDNYAKELLEEAKEQVFCNAAIEPIITHVIENFHYNIITEILDEIVSKRVKIEFILAKYPNFNDYLIKLHDFLEVDKNDNYKQEIRKDFADKIDISFLNELEKKINLFGSKGDLEKGVKIKDLELKIIESCDGGISFEDFQQAFCNKKGEFFKRVVTSAVSKEVADYEAKIGALCKLYSDRYEVYKKYELAEITENLLLISKLFLTSYSALKDQKNLLDYEDIILATLNLLKSSQQRDNILYKYDLSLEHILLDEAQDTSPWQWEIMKLLLEDFFSGGHNDERDKSFFIVGDEKQSIYSFQGADHKLFSRIKGEFKHRLSNIGKELNEIQLDTSYRSQEPILSLVDGFFNQDNIKAKLAENIDKIEHKVSRNNDNSDLRVWSKLDKESNKTSLPYWQYPKEYVQKSFAKDDIAENIASFIQEKLNKGAKIASTSKALQAKDILILTRKRDQNYKSIINALEIANIPVQSDQRFKLLDHVLIMDLVGFLKFIYFPEDDLNLASILKSPLFNKSESDIFNICHNRGETSIYEQVSLDGEICEKLKNMQEMASILDLKAFYLHILETLGLKRQYLEIYGKKAAHLCELFLNIVDNFSQQSDNKSKFLEFIHSYEINAGSEIVSDLDAVTVMTMHKSKGLQAPMVIVALDNYQKSKLKRNYLEVDFANDLVLAANSRKIADLEVYLKEFAEQRNNEELRLLYVALTRARDELHIVPFDENEEDDIYNKLKEICPNEVPVINKNEVLTEPKVFQPVIIESKEEAKTSDSLSFAVSGEVVTPSSHETIVTPSSQTLHNKKQAQIGTIYHELFNYLIRGGKVANLRRFTEISYKYISDNERVHIVKDICDIYEDSEFSDLFHASGYSELALTMKEENKVITGRIDRLLIDGNIATIIDYKFEKNAEISPNHQKQLSFYEKLVRANFPNVTTVNKQLFFIPTRKTITL